MKYNKRKILATMNGERETLDEEVKHKVCMVMRCKCVYIMGIGNGIIFCWEFSKAFEMFVVPKLKCCNDAYVL